MICVSVHIWGLVTHLQIEQNSSYPHSLAHFQAVGEEREAWWALIVGRQNLNVHCGDGAPGSRMIRHTSAHWQHRFLLDNLLSRAEVPRPQQGEKYSQCMKPRGSLIAEETDFGYHSLKWDLCLKQNGVVNGCFDYLSIHCVTKQL